MYDFNKYVDRRNSNSMKWDVGNHELPLWVADMDFKTAPSVIDALVSKARAGVFGYTIVPDTWYEAIMGWWSRRHSFTLQKEWLIFTTGVVAAISTAVNRLTNVGDNVLVQTPVYNIFFNSIINHGRHVVTNDLIYDGDKYKIDFEDLEQQLSHPLTSMMILCNPHNPIGKIWRESDLKKIGELCYQYNVVLLADEIHGDLTDPGYEYQPFASVSDVCKNNSVTCSSVSKTFNLAGLQSAYVSIPNPVIRAKMERGLNSREVAEPNAFAIEAVIAAYNEGDKWLDELRDYLMDNKRMVKTYLNEHLPSLKVVHGHATYLLWLDFSDICQDTGDLYTHLREKAGLYLSKGEVYGGNGGYFLRMNVACPKSTLQEALNRLKKGIETYMNV